MRKRLLNNDARHQVVARLATRFVGIYDIAAAIDKSLAEIGAFAGADRAYVFILSPDGKSMDRTHEWCCDRAAAQRESLQGVRLDSLPWLMPRLKQGKAVHVPDIARLPGSAQLEKQYLERQDIKALLLVPVLVGSEIAALVGFDNTTASPDWRPADLQLLRIAADIMASALERSIAEQQLEERTIAESILAKLLELGLKDIPLKKQLQSAIDVITSVPFMRLRPQGGIFLADNDSRELRLAANRGLPKTLRQMCGKVPFGDCLCGRVAASGRMLFTGRLDERHDHHYEQMVPHGHYVVPLKSRQGSPTLLGVLVLYVRHGHRTSAREQEFLKAVANSLASIVERSQAEESLRLSEQRYRTVANTLQESLLILPEHLEGVDFGHFYRSATEAARVGGDFYDLVELEDNKVGIVMGDVSGNGLEAATLTTVVKNTLRAYSYDESSPAAVMAKTNEVVRKTTDPYTFVTVFFGVLDFNSGRLRYCSAGHPPGILKRRGAETLFLKTNSPLIGLFTDQQYHDDVEIMDPGDILVLYTDGVTEARHDGDLYGEHRLISFLESIDVAGVGGLPRAVLAEVMDFTDGKLADDIALLTVAMRPGQKQRRLRKAG